MIEFKGVSKLYPDGTHAVDDFSVVIPSRKTTVFVGSSGCGKTTLLRMINRMVDPTSGSIEIDSEDIAKTEPVHLRRSMATSCRTRDCCRTARCWTTWPLFFS